MTETHDTAEIEPPLLDPVQAHVLDCLLEKERATPVDHPLTLNAFTRAFDQSTSRWSVVDDCYSEVGAQLDSRSRRRAVTGSPSGRTVARPGSN